jgi:hypothetical protein
MAKAVSSSPFQAMEEEAYHAFREWPIFLVLRQKTLDAHLAAVPTPPGAAEAAPAEGDPEPCELNRNREMKEGI